MSTDEAPCKPPTWRRPSTKTNVRSAPRPRRFSTFAPLANPLSIDCSDVTDPSNAGMSLMTSESENSPDALISAADTD